MSIFLGKHNVNIIVQQKASRYTFWSPNVRYKHGFLRVGKFGCEFWLDQLVACFSPFGSSPLLAIINKYFISALAVSGVIEMLMRYHLKI